MAAGGYPDHYEKEKLFQVENATTAQFFMQAPNRGWKNHYGWGSTGSPGKAKI